MPTLPEIEQFQFKAEDLQSDGATAETLCNLLQNMAPCQPGYQLYAQQFFQLANKLNEPAYNAWASLFISWRHVGAGELYAAKDLADSAYLFFTSQNNLRGMAASYLRYGEMESVKEQYTAALEYYFKAAEIYENTADYALVLAFDFIAHAYSDTFNQDLAIAYFEKALLLFQKAGNKFMMARCYNNIGANYFDLDRNLSLHYHLNSLKIAGEIANKHLMSYSYYWVGTIYIDKGEIELAEDYLQKARELCEEISHYHILAYVHVSLGKLRTMSGNYAPASVHFETAWQIAIDAGNKMWERAVYRDWYLLKKTQNDFEGALEMHEKYIRLDREVTHTELAEKVAAVKFKADLEKKQKDLEIQHLHNVELKKEMEVAEQLRRAAEESKRFKEQFLANMSHEIRTPMNAVLGMTNLLLDTTLNNKQKGYLLAVKKSSENLLVILNDILDLSKLEAGKMEFEMLPFRLNELVTHAMDMLRFKAEEKGLLCTAEISAEVPPVVMGDAARLNQVLINVLSNAIKFTDKGSVKLLIAEGPLGHLQFTVTDTGIGMSPAQQLKVFDSFTQAESNTNRKYGGTGLGLAICKTLVELLGGNIELRSEPGKGSEFSFTVPYIAGSERDIAGPAPVTHTDYSALTKMKILVAEDYEFNQVVIKDTLEHLLPGVRVEVVANGKIAVEKLKQNSYDMVLMDVQMPEMDGYEATRVIRNEMKMRIPIIALTASVIRSDLDKCMATGMNGYIPKPFERDALLKELLKHIPIVVN